MRDRPDRQGREGSPDDRRRVAGMQRSSDDRQGLRPSDGTEGLLPSCRPSLRIRRLSSRLALWRTLPGQLRLLVGRRREGARGTSELHRDARLQADLESAPRTGERRHVRRRRSRPGWARETAACCRSSVPAGSPTRTSRSPTMRRCSYFVPPADGGKWSTAASTAWRAWCRRRSATPPAKSANCSLCSSGEHKEQLTGGWPSLARRPYSDSGPHSPSSYSCWSSSSIPCRPSFSYSASAPYGSSS